MKLTDRELGTVLAALRMYQRALAEYRDEPFSDIATNGGTVHPLDESEIDALCERLNR